MAARDEPHHRLLRQRRTFRERKNVLNELDDHELIKKYRQDRAGIVFVTDLVRERLRRPTARNKALSPPRCKLSSPRGTLLQARCSSAALITQVLHNRPSAESSLTPWKPSQTTSSSPSSSNSQSPHRKLRGGSVNLE